MTQYEQKHRAILDAATRAFLQHGYLATNMEQIARDAGVSKQTLYTHCANKEALFLDIIADLTARATALAQQSLPDVSRATNPQAYLEQYARRELETLLVPEVIRLRRLVIGEADRFPEVAQAFYESGPIVGFQALARMLDSFVDRDLLTIADTRRAAEDLNWLILAHHLHRAMFLGEGSVPSKAEIRAHARRVVRFFLQALETGNPRREARRVAELFGTLERDTAYDHKSERSRRS